MLKVTAVSNWQALAPYASRWNSLADASSNGSVFQSYEWNEAWWQSFGHGHELLVLLVEQGDRLLAVAPMMMSRKVVRLIGSLNYASDYCDWIVDPSKPEAATEILKWLGERRSSWDRLDWVNLPSHSPRRALMEREFDVAGICSDLLCDAPTRILGNRADDQAVLSKKSIKRHFNYFQKNGELRFWHCDSKKEILEHLDAFFQQHIERRDLTEDGSQFREQAQRDFYKRLVNSLWSRGVLRFSVVSFDSVPIAYHFGFESGGRYIWYKPSFNVSYLKKSPGEVLLKFLLEYSIEKGLEEFDFTVGEEAFKYRFANRVRTNHRLIAFSDRWDYIGFMCMRRVRRAFRSIRAAFLNPFGRSEIKKPLIDPRSEG